MKKLNRIYIIGSMGSGKTTFAKKLSQIKNIQHYDLDDIYYVKKFSRKRNKKERVKKLNSIIRNKKWIIEGVYRSWTDKVFEKSDLIILLDIEYKHLRRRLIKRQIKRKPFAIKSLIRLIRIAKKFKVDEKEKPSRYKSYLECIEKYKVPLVILRNDEEIKLFLEDFCEK